MEPKLKYLVVEDSLKVCNGIKQRVDDFCEWECCGFAHHVADAVKLIKTHRPRLIFLDWALKGGSAYEVLQSIYRLRPYQPYIIFNTGYQSENPEIPQEIINNYKIDIYLVKPLWEKLSLHLHRYLREAAEKSKQFQSPHKEIWLTDIARQRHHVHAHNIVCVQQHFNNPYYKVFYFTDQNAITVKMPWPDIYKMLEEHNILFFITNSREHIIIKKYIQHYRRPYVQLSHFRHKIEVVKNKLSAFEKWIGD